MYFQDHHLDLVQNMAKETTEQESVAPLGFGETEEEDNPRPQK